ncbi:SWIM zinc finger family protein [Dyella subtropica]|uniref:SWIM zinc finger family protein n=1 Tax=Dyella subtropica TaxID=2992127 RepID=UPI0022573F9E|nr:SWIM zinc finger family protein [Dyella subtropica]
MGVALTTEQVLALAPDAASAKAAAGLTGTNHWVLLGGDDDAVWGECKGSGAKPYQTQVDLAALLSRCTCPSRKFPCKHGLALLLLYAQQAAGLPRADRPAWVGEWLASRKEKAEKKEQAAKAPVDPVAAAEAALKREAGRWKRIESGCADLQLWIADQFRRGLASFGPEQRKEWAAMAARMVDAQAPGLAQQLQDALDAMSAGSSRQDEAIERLGLLQLINEGVSRREQLSPERLADLRVALGWPHDKEDVVAGSDTVEDDWQVLGQLVIARDERLNERRIWLHGRESGRYALLLDYAHNSKGWESYWSETSYRARLSFYPGTMPLRAVVTAQAPSPAQAWPGVSLEHAIEQASHWFAANPWQPQVPMLLASATPVLQEGGWMLHTAAGTLSLRTHESSAWSLLAFSGGHPVSVMGEWDGRRLRPLVAQHPVEPTRRWALVGEEVAT